MTSPFCHEDFDDDHASITAESEFHDLLASVAVRLDSKNSDLIGGAGTGVGTRSDVPVAHAVGSIANVVVAEATWDAVDSGTHTHVVHTQIFVIVILIFIMRASPLENVHKDRFAYGSLLDTLVDVMCT